MCDKNKLSATQFCVSDVSFAGNYCISVAETLKSYKCFSSWICSGLRNFIEPDSKTLADTKPHKALSGKFAVAYLLRTFVTIVVCWIVPIPHAIAQNADLSEVDADIMERAQKFDKRGTSIFPVKVAGETYNELSGAIGHSATDMVVSGNGLLSYSVKRQFEEIPDQYPYALGTMSLMQPHMMVEMMPPNDNKTPEKRFCSTWRDEGAEAYNTIQFYHENGMVELLPRHAIHLNYRNLYPSSALYISKNNWILDCDDEDPTKYRVQSPIGVEYLMNPVNGAERFRSTRPFEQRSQRYNHVYKMHVTRKSYQNSRIDYLYTASPVASNVGPALKFEVDEPLWKAHSSSPTSDSRNFDKSIAIKRRLYRVELIVSPESSRHKDGENHYVYFDYRSNDEETCPGKLASVRSSSSVVPAVYYDYDTGSSYPTCLLQRVRHQVGDSATDTEIVWDFKYRFRDGQAYMGGAGGTAPNSAFNYLPLHMVRTPDGAKVRYEYNVVGICEYQTIKSGSSGCATFLDKNGSVAGTDRSPRRPVVKLRTVFGDESLLSSSDFSRSGQSTTFDYHQQDVSNYTVDRIIKYDLPSQNSQTGLAGELKHTLTFGRVVRDKEPVGLSVESINESPERDRWLNSGRLLKILTQTPDTNDVSVLYRYREGSGVGGGEDGVAEGDSFLTFLNEEWKEKDSWVNNNRQYLFSQRRINLHRKITTLDEVTYEVRNNSFDDFNGVSSKTEFYSVENGESDQRETTYEYDNAYIGKNVWFVGAIAATITEASAQTNTAPLINRFVYNVDGLLAVKYKAGFLTNYSYHDMGNLKEETTASGNTTTYENYKSGVARSTFNAESEHTQRNIDQFGNVTREIDPADKVTVFEYEDRYRQLKRIKVDGNVADTIIANPLWLDRSVPTDFRKKREVQGNYLKTTTYDYRGLVLSVSEQDVSDPSSGGKVWYLYDNLGRILFESDTHPNNSFTSSGTSYTYDGLGRIKTQRHSADPAGTAIKYCYDSCTSIPGNQRLENGYTVEDLDGYITLYNYRSFGTPHNKKLVQVSQQITKKDSDTISADAVVTNITRNKIGFITSVIQYSSLNPSEQRFRNYAAYQRGYTRGSGVSETSSTHLIQSESISELFGVERRVKVFDDVGNPKVVIGYDGEETEYVYDKAYRLRFHLNKANDTNDIQYQYYKNGMLKSVQHEGSLWKYTYNVNNDLESESLSIDGQSDLFTVGYTYDNLQNVNVMTYPSGRVIDYDYNALGQPISIEGYVSNAEYFPSGLIKRIDYSNGQTFESTQDEKKRPKVWRQYLADNEIDSEIIDYTYSYDARSNVSSIENYFVHQEGGTRNKSSLIGLSYDGLSRLKSAEGFWNHDSDDGAYRLRYSYNAFGDFTARYENSQVQTYHYRTGGLLDEIRYPSNANGPLALEFKYDRDFDPSGKGNGNIVKNGSFATESSRIKYNQMNQLNFFPAEQGRRGQENLYDGNMMRVKSIITEVDEFQETVVASASYQVYALNSLLLHESPIGLGETKDHVYFNGNRIATHAKHGNIDTDSDGVPDYIENQYGLNSNDSEDAKADNDGDGLSNLFEYQNGLILSDSDSDSDGISDYDDPDTPFPTDNIALVDGLSAINSDVAIGSRIMVTFALAETAGVFTDIDGIELLISDANGNPISQLESETLPIGRFELNPRELKIISAEAVIAEELFLPGEYTLELRYREGDESFVFPPAVGQSNPLAFTVQAPEYSVPVLVVGFEETFGLEGTQKNFELNGSDASGYLGIAIEIAEQGGKSSRVDSLEIWLLAEDGSDVKRLVNSGLPVGEVMMSAYGQRSYFSEIALTDEHFEPGNYFLELRYRKSGILQLLPTENPYIRNRAAFTVNGSANKLYKANIEPVINFFMD